VTSGSGGVGVRGAGGGPASAVVSALSAITIVGSPASRSQAPGLMNARSAKP
jgi:hypothetical protein